MGQFSVEIMRPNGSVLSGNQHAADQTLVKLDKGLHQLYHSGLDNVAPRWKGTSYYKGLGGSEKAAILRDVAQHTREFDKKYGTHLYDAMMKNGFPGS